MNVGKYDVVALGELLIDFTDAGQSNQGNPQYEANPGGAPCNVLSMLAKLGIGCAFIGKVGKDSFGRQLRESIRKVGIDDSGLVEDENIHTTLAFVHKLADGDRDFSFYRNPGADMMLNEYEVNDALIKGCQIFHFGSLSMTSEICEKATKKAVSIAKESGKFITFDPNLRESLWESLDKAKEKIEYGISVCNMLKISDNEIEWLTGEVCYNRAIDILMEKYPNIDLMLLSLGKEGSMAITKNKRFIVPAFIREDTVETTGAGDTFCGCVIAKVVELLNNGRTMLSMSDDEMIGMLKFANAAASIITTRKGALMVMPRREEITELIA